MIDVIDLEKKYKDLVGKRITTTHKHKRSKTVSTGTIILASKDIIVVQFKNYRESYQIKELEKNIIEHIIYY